MNALMTICIALSHPALPHKDFSLKIPPPDPFKSAVDSEFEPPPPPFESSDVIERFLEYQRRSDAYSSEAESFVADQAHGLDENGMREFPSLAFSILEPGFKQALDLIEEDNTKAAADAFEALSNSDDPFLAVASANLAATAMIETDDIERCQSMLERVSKAHSPVERFTTSADHFRFMEAYCMVHNLQYDVAVLSLESFLKNHPGAPERLRSASQQILTELSRRIPGRLGDVRDLLSYARRRIAGGDTDQSVQRRQAQAVALLDSLIEEAEEQEKNCGGGGDGEGGGKNGGNSGGNQPGGGAKRSALPQGEGDVGELRRARAQPGEMWGKMPPKQREEILQTLQRQFPSQYRELLEQYYNQLAKNPVGP